MPYIGSEQRLAEQKKLLKQLDKAQEPHGTKKLEFLDIIVPVTPEQNGEEIERDGGDEVDCEPPAEVVLRHLVVVG